MLHAFQEGQIGMHAFEVSELCAAGPDCVLSGQRRCRRTSTVAFTAILTIAGGAAAWGLFLLITYALWSPPSAMRSSFRHHALAGHVGALWNSRTPSLQQVRTPHLLSHSSRATGCAVNLTRTYIGAQMSAVTGICKGLCRCAPVERWLWIRMRDHC